LQTSQTITKEQLCLIEEKSPSCSIVIFGASGDLANRKLFPSLFYLYTEGHLPKDFYFLGVARTAMTDELFREKIRANLPINGNSDKVAPFLERCFYVSGEYGETSFYRKIHATLIELDKKFNVGNRRIFYLSTPPPLYSAIINQLGRSDLAYAD